MSQSNRRIWDALGKTDPAHTKGFQRSGGFKGTAIKPMYCNQRMTEFFGPCGIGWGPGEPKFETREANNECLVFCTVALWYMEGDIKGTVYGVGGDKYLISQTSGLRTSDEAFKAAYTDALGNGMKLIGVAADVHMGLFDDSKYVRETAAEFAAGQSAPAQQPQRAATQQTPPQQQQRIAPANTGGGKFKTITEGMSKRFHAIAREGGKSKADKDYYLKNVCGVEDSLDMHPDRYEAACAWAAAEQPNHVPPSVPSYSDDPGISDDDIPF